MENNSSKKKTALIIFSLIFDLIMIGITAACYYYSSLPTQLQLIMPYAWIGVMAIALVVAIIGVIVNQDYDTIRGFLIDTFLLVVFGVWLGITNGYVLSLSADSNIVKMFINGSGLIIIVSIIFHLDLILYDQTRHFMTTDKAKNNKKRLGGRGVDTIPAAHDPIEARNVGAPPKRPKFNRPGTDFGFSSLPEEKVTKSSVDNLFSSADSAETLGSQKTDEKVDAFFERVENTSPNRTHSHITTVRQQDIRPTASSHPTSAAQETAPVPKSNTADEGTRVIPSLRAQKPAKAEKPASSKTGKINREKLLHRETAPVETASLSQKDDSDKTRIIHTIQNQTAQRKKQAKPKDEPMPSVEKRRAIREPRSKQPTAGRRSVQTAPRPDGARVRSDHSSTPRRPTVGQSPIRQRHNEAPVNSRAKDKPSQPKPEPKKAEKHIKLDHSDIQWTSPLQSEIKERIRVRKTTKNSDQ